MALEEVNTKLAQIALAECEGFPFERFTNDFLAATLPGEEFVPVGGTSDGGADGIQETGLVSSQKKSGQFYQFSIQENYRSKIKGTVARLKEFGRNVTQLIYITSQQISTYDTEEERLTDELGVIIRIRELKWIISNLNKNEATKKAYYTHLAHYTDFLRDLDNAHQIKVSENISHPSVYVFLQQQVQNKENGKHLTKTVADTLILWALNDTNPDKDLFMTRDEILTRIKTTIPWAKNIVTGMLNERLRELSRKVSGAKYINHHKKDDKFCLPFETREIVALERSEDEVLIIDVISEIESFDILAEYEPDKKKYFANLAIRVCQLFFEREGLNCSSYLNTSSSNAQNSFIENIVFDRVMDALKEAGVSSEEQITNSETLCEIVRRMFYVSTQKQRLLLIKFSRTYVLLFTLQAEPRVVEYFQKATANFRLLVGTDLIIRAISERFLSKENQMTRNLFEMARVAGIKLILTEPALDGIIKHLIVTDNEYFHHIRDREKHLTDEIVRESSQILIRTYYHAKKYEGYDKSWQNFMSEFLSHKKLHDPQGKDELRTYLCYQFGMEYLSREDLSLGTSAKDVEQLANQIIDIKKNNRLLATDVALTINAVYAQRQANKESSIFPEYGYQTWWLTQETKVQNHTEKLVKKHAAKFIMRPEFLLNFFALSPSVDDIKESYKTIFPSVMGLQMGNRLPDHLFHKVLEQVDEWASSDAGRVAAKTRALCDRLKAEHFDDEVNYNAIDKILADCTEQD